MVARASSSFLEFTSNARHASSPLGRARSCANRFAEIISPSGRPTCSVNPHRARSVRVSRSLPTGMHYYLPTNFPPASRS